MTESELKAIEERAEKATEGPWAWTHIGEKCNGYIVGTIWDKDDKQIEGHVPDEDFYEDEVVLRSADMGEHEAATCNYNDPAFIAHSRTDIPKLLAEVRRLKAAVQEKDAEIAKLKDQLSGCQEQSFNRGNLLIQYTDEVKKLKAENKRLKERASQDSAVAEAKAEVIRAARKWKYPMAEWEVARYNLTILRAIDILDAAMKSEQAKDQSNAER